MYKFFLHDCNSIPAVGLGTFLLHNGSLLKNETFPFPILLDTAEKYENTEIIKSMICDLKYNKQDFQILTKINYKHQIQRRVKEIIINELQKYQLDLFDVILIHSPRYERFWETWEELETLKNQHYVKSIGVSNFGIDELNTLEKITGSRPAINQLMINPSAYPKELISHCQAKDICVQAYSPLANGKLFTNNFPILKDIAVKKNRTMPQIALRWLYQLGIASVPKSSTVQHLRENMQIFDFELDANELNFINTNSYICTA